MPPRTLTLAIVGLWLAMAGLFFWHEVWPRLEPSEPLMFPVDIVDEAGYQSEVTSWEVSKNGAPGYRADVDWRYHDEDDSFESQCELFKGLSYKVPVGRLSALLQSGGAFAAAPCSPPAGSLLSYGVQLIFLDSEDYDPDWEPPRPSGPAALVPAWLPQLRYVKTSSSYRLTRQGDMRSIDLRSEYRLSERYELKDKDAPGLVAEIRGEPRSGRFTPRIKLKLDRPEGLDIGPLHAAPFDRFGATVPVLGHGTVLNPLHPPRRFPNLQEGQRWRAAVINPLPLFALATARDSAQSNYLPDAGLPLDRGTDQLDARVLPGIQQVNWELGKAACRVVHCTSLGPVASITYYVREHDGALMRQDVRLWGDTWSFLRRPHGFKMRGPGTRIRI
jgi:hypothetical protein